ncbi:MAG TPA: spermidine/putrescine ABC transporter substrate-binding protein [Actinomycetota bacterium]|nr:spermidine/putrescine ABC transporter substrate-binding protein [Actinomycetota bacterium]
MDGHFPPPAGRPAARWLEPRWSRRDFLGRIGRGAGLLAAGGLLAACDSDTAGPIEPATSVAEPIDWEAWWSERRQTGRLDFANWPYYIDFRAGGRQSLDLFSEETGIHVNYFHTIESNDSFMQEIEPYLEAGLAPFYDLIVMTNGPQVSKLIGSGYLTPLDHSRLRNFDRYASELVRDPGWDPGNRYTVAWQSGITGVAYRPEAVEALGHAPTSLADLFDPALEGRVGMMSDLQDLGCAALLSVGIEPQDSRERHWLKAADALREQRASGVVAGYYDQSYIRALLRGDVWIAQAWSGDVFQQQQLGREIEFLVPEEGALLWTDNMMIPRNAKHPVDAMTLMDFVYRPDIAAMIADWVWYVCPVPAAERIIARRFDHPEVARSPLVFPSVESMGPDGPYREYRVFEGEEEAETWNSIFGSIPLGL